MAGADAAVPLRYEWKVWIDPWHTRGPKEEQACKESDLEPVGVCRDLQTFLDLSNKVNLQELSRSSVHVFKASIVPVVLDPALANGGQLKVVMKNPEECLALWQPLTSALVKNEWERCEDVCGASLDIRNKGNSLRVWITNSADHALVQLVRKQVAASVPGKLTHPLALVPNKVLVLAQQRKIALMQKEAEEQKEAERLEAEKLAAEGKELKESEESSRIAQQQQETHIQQNIGEQQQDHQQVPQPDAMWAEGHGIPSPPGYMPYPASFDFSFGEQGHTPLREQYLSNFGQFQYPDQGLAPVNQASMAHQGHAQASGSDYGGHPQPPPGGYMAAPHQQFQHGSQAEALQHPQQWQGGRPPGGYPQSVTPPRPILGSNEFLAPSRSCFEPGQIVTSSKRSEGSHRVQAQDTGSLWVGRGYGGSKGSQGSRCASPALSVCSEVSDCSFGIYQSNPSTPQGSTPRTTTQLAVALQQLGDYFQQGDCPRDDDVASYNSGQMGHTPSYSQRNLPFYPDSSEGFATPDAMKGQRGRWRHGSTRSIASSQGSYRSSRGSFRNDSFASMQDAHPSMQEASPAPSTTLKDASGNAMHNPYGDHTDLGRSTCNSQGDLTMENSMSGMSDDLGMSGMSVSMTDSMVVSVTRTESMGGASVQLMLAGTQLSTDLSTELSSLSMDSSSLGTSLKFRNSSNSFPSSPQHLHSSFEPGQMVGENVRSRDRTESVHSDKSEGGGSQRSDGARSESWSDAPEVQEMDFSVPLEQFMTRDSDLHSSCASNCSMSPCHSRSDTPSASSKRGSTKSENIFVSHKRKSRRTSGTATPTSHTDSPMNSERTKAEQNTEPSSTSTNTSSSTTTKTKDEVKQPSASSENSEKTPSAENPVRKASDAKMSEQVEPVPEDKGDPPPPEPDGPDKQGSPAEPSEPSPANKTQTEAVEQSERKPKKSRSPPKKTNQKKAKVPFPEVELTNGPVSQENGTQSQTKGHMNLCEVSSHSLKELVQSDSVPGNDSVEAQSLPPKSKSKARKDAPNASAQSKEVTNRKTGKQDRKEAKDKKKKKNAPNPKQITPKITPNQSLGSMFNPSDAKFWFYAIPCLVLSFFLLDLAYESM